MGVRVLIVDDHEVVRAGIHLMLSDDPEIEIIGECENGRAALRLAHDLHPDVIIMDITMPEMNGIEATRHIKAELADVSVVALTIHDGPDYLFQMLQAGASGYVPKQAGTEDLLRAIKVVASGNIFLEPSVATNLVADYLERARAGKETYGGLTERELEVLTLIAEGAGNQEIAIKLNISVKTVERHRENMMHKLRLHSRTELVKYAIRKGLILLEGDFRELTS